MGVLLKLHFNLTKIVVFFVFCVFGVRYGSPKKMKKLRKKWPTSTVASVKHFSLIVAVVRLQWTQVS